MKTLFSVLSTFLLSFSVFAQSTQPTVTINTTGNRNKQVIIDGKNYSITNLTANDDQDIVITDLSIGQHSLDVVRSNINSNRTTSTKTTFTVRDGYDLAITIGASGAVSSAEKRIARWGNNNNNNNQLSTNAYNKLYSQVIAKTTATSRATLLETEWGNLNKKMTAQQASKLIQLVNSESLRLKLAKLAYADVSDQQNFSLVTNLLSSTYSRNELKTYIASLDTEVVDETGNVAGNNQPLTDAQFQQLYEEVNSETSTSRVYYLNNYFAREDNFYTSAQAKQLLELVPVESDRLTVAKNAYRGISDRENYGVVYQTLSNPYNRSQLVTYINTYDNEHPKSGITTANFDKLYQSVYNQTNSTNRYNAINTAFTSGGNYFTVAQAKKMITLVNSETSRLQLTKNAYKVLVDRTNYTQFNDLLSSTASRNDLTTYVNNYNNLYVGNGVAMSETDYNKLYKNVSASWNGSARFNLEADAFRNTNNYFTTYQVKQLLSLITSENDKLTLAKNSYDNIVDVNNFTELYSLFTTNGKNDLANFVTNTQNGTTTAVKIPMSESEFNTQYRKVQMTFGLGAKYSSLVTIFNTETNNFTVAQAKQLIGLVSSESNRLELAKSSYNNITDPANFPQIYELLSSQTSRNELMTYVGAAAYNN